MLRAFAVMVILFSAVSAFAQVENNLVDVSGGYALSRSSGITANGWYGDVGIRAYKSLYAVGGVAAFYYSDSAVLNGTSVKLSANSYSIGGGPRVFLTRRHSIVSPFADFLVSYGHSSASVTGLGAGSSASDSLNSLGVDIGGGADFRINQMFSIRVRPGYAMARAEGETQSSFAFMTGIVLHFGE